MYPDPLPYKHFHHRKTIYIILLIVSGSHCCTIQFYIYLLQEELIKYKVVDSQKETKRCPEISFSCHASLAHQHNFVDKKPALLPVSVQTSLFLWITFMKVFRYQEVLPWLDRWLFWFYWTPPSYKPFRQVEFLFLIGIQWSSVKDLWDFLCQNN